MKLLFRFIFWITGWKVEPFDFKEKKCVMTAAPHTSNWDYIYCLAAFDILNIPVRYTIKKEMNLPIIGWFIEKAGAIWIDRTPKNPGEKRLSTVDAMTNLFDGRDELTVLVTPEGTRSLRTKWKTGFYHVAKNAGVPIALGYLDFEKKQAGVGDLFWPTDDIEADMKRIMNFYAPIAPKHPELFKLDEKYYTNK